MTSLPKAMRRAVLTAKTLATAIAPEFKRTPLATGGKAVRPRVFYRGTNPGDDRRISTGDKEWDSHTFAADSRDHAKMYGRRIERLEAKPDTKILYEGTSDWNKVAGRWRKGENMLQYASRAAKAAKDSGYHAAHFKLQGTVGTAIFDRDRFDSFDEGGDDVAKASGGAVDGDDAPDDDSPYYSPLAQGLKGAKLETGPAAYWRNTILKLPGAAEAKDTGLHDFIDSHGGDIQKQALLEHLAMNSPQLQEHWFEEDPKRKLHENRPRFTDHTLDGGTNHKELSINLPEKPGGNGPNFISPAGHRYQRMQTKSNFDPADVNRIAHVRMNDRRGPKGEKLLHIDELQSDWHQKGREHGYKFEKPYFYAQNRKSGFRSEDFDTEDKAKAYHSKLPHSIRDDVEIKRGTHSNPTGVPNAPLKDTKQWTELALRRAIKHAADNGYHGITWTTGDQQADRYDLSKHIDEIRSDPWTTKPGWRTVNVALPKDGHGVEFSTDEHGKVGGVTGYGDGEEMADGWRGKHISDVLGKDIGKQILESDKPLRISGSGLRVGGEGMRKFYDEIVPSVANKIGREHGVQASKIRLPDPEEKNYTIMPPHGGVGIHHLFHGDEPVTSSLHREALERHRDRLLEAHDVHYLPVTPSMAGKKVRKYKRGGTVKPELGPAVMIAANVLNRKKRGQ